MIIEEPWYLEKLTPSRKKVHEGDLFVLKLKSVGYLCGYVVSTTANWTHIDDPKIKCNLLYIYRDIRPTPDVPSLDQFKLDRLLIPPQLTNNLGWRHSYYQTIANIPRPKIETLEEHVFKSGHTVFGEYLYYNEFAQETKPDSESIGTFGLASYLSIESKICDALGLKKLE